MAGFEHIEGDTILHGRVDRTLGAYALSANLTYFMTGDPTLLYQVSAMYRVAAAWTITASLMGSTYDLDPTLFGVGLRYAFASNFYAGAALLASSGYGFEGASIYVGRKFGGDRNAR